MVVSRKERRRGVNGSENRIPREGFHALWFISLLKRSTTLQNTDEIKTILTLATRTTTVVATANTSHLTRSCSIHFTPWNLLLTEVSSLFSLRISTTYIVQCPTSCIHINTMDCKYFCRENGIKTWKMTFPYEFDAWFRNGVYANVGGTLKAWHRNHYKAMEIIKIGTHSRVLLNTVLCEHV